MEDTLGVTRARLIFTFNAVLILVLMEDTLGDSVKTPLSEQLES